ncbi:MAG: hypothetical protein L0Y37_01095 [Bacteroidales bacterium]|nr:hypothetical protein [Bacteroidales bacterium]
MRTPDGQSSTVVMKYTLDGKGSVNSTGRGTSKSYATWSADGKTLSPNGERTITTVYNKK